MTQRPVPTKAQPEQLRVYAAHPLTTYGTPHARCCLDAITARLPGCELADPETIGWKTSEAWLDDWPDLLESLDALVVFGAEDGTVGIGCVREVADAIAAGIPVAGFALDKGVVELVDVDFLPMALRSALRVGTLRLGESCESQSVAR